MCTLFCEYIDMEQSLVLIIGVHRAAGRLEDKANDVAEACKL